MNLITSLSNWSTVIVALITGSFALTQLRFNNITNARIKWLETLKSLLSDYVSECNSLSIKIGIIEGIMKLIDPKTATAETREYHNRLNMSLPEDIKKVHLKYELLRLYIDLEDELHLEFEKLLDQSMKIINTLPTLIELQKIDQYSLFMRKNSEMTVKLLRTIMRLEWIRLRNPLLFYFKYSLFKKSSKLVVKIKAEISQHYKEVAI